MNEEKNYVKVEIGQFSELIRNDFILEALGEAIFSRTALNWNKNGLNFHDDSLNTVMKLFFPYAYQTRLAKLKKEEETNDNI